MSEKGKEYIIYEPSIYGNVTGMFYNCTKLNDITACGNVTGMFYNCTNLTDNNLLNFIIPQRNVPKSK